VPALACPLFSRVALRAVPGFGPSVEIPRCFALPRGSAQTLAPPATAHASVRLHLVHPRNVRPGATYLITRRCIERRFLLRPSQLTNQIIEYCLGVAAERSGVELHVFCAMSNHVHAVLTDVEGRLPEFLHHFHRNVAVALNASLGRTENVWSVGQTSAVELGDEWDILEKMAYVVANPTAAGLLRSPQKWPGVITTKLCEMKTVRRAKG
jgi:REP element-mobilizing transposase RayT